MFNGAPFCSMVHPFEAEGLAALSSASAMGAKQSNCSNCGAYAEGTTLWRTTMTHPTAMGMVSICNTKQFKTKSVAAQTSLRHNSPAGEACMCINHGTLKSHSKGSSTVRVCIPPLSAEHVMLTAANIARRHTCSSHCHWAEHRYMEDFDLSVL